MSTPRELHLSVVILSGGGAAPPESKDLRSSPAPISCSRFFCFLLLLTAFSPAQVKPWNQIQPPPLPAFKPQEPIRVQLPNGMVIFLQEDHELPLIDATARIRGGSISEAGEQDRTHRSLRRGLAHRRHQDQDRRSDGRLPGSARRQDRNRQPVGLDHHLAQLPEGRLRRRVRDVSRSAAQSRVPSRQAGAGEGADVHGNFAPQRQRGFHRASRKPHHRLRQRQSLRARCRVRDGCRGHPRRPAELAPAVRVSQQHHLRHHRRLRSRRPWKPSCARPSIRGRRGRRPSARHQVHRAEAGLVFRPQDRREPEQHRHARPRHRAQQSRLLRGDGDERDVWRQLLLAAVQPSALRKRACLQRGRRRGFRLGPSRA